ncbi:GNAT family N-acetyltransferase [bacterium]|nr:GNAT family N-acetyltransferase [bacterium]
MTQPSILLLPFQWTTTRLTIADGVLDDVARLTAVFNACSYVEPWDPTFHVIAEDELRQVIEQSLSTGDDHRYFRLQAVRLAGEDNPIGYFHLWHWSPRLPQADTAFISMFVIHPDFQGQRYAQEVVDGLADQLRQLGYAAIWLEVYLKNWPALRFWMRQGFTRIVTYDGDPAHSATAHASLVLERRLNS